VKVFYPPAPGATPKRQLVDISSFGNDVAAGAHFMDAVGWGGVAARLLQLSSPNPHGTVLATIAGVRVYDHDRIASTAYVAKATPGEDTADASGLPSVPVVIDKSAPQGVSITFRNDHPTVALNVWQYTPAGALSQTWAVAAGGTEVTKTANGTADIYYIASHAGGAAGTFQVKVDTVTNLVAPPAPGPRSRVRIYDRIIKRNADRDRPSGTAPTGDHGVLVDVAVGGADPIVTFTPPIDAANVEDPAQTVLPFTITNLEAGTLQPLYKLLLVNTENP
jgi:hypothetical protein